MTNQGITCSKCGGSTEVTDSRNGSFYKRRRRECRDCGRRFSTYETTRIPTEIPEAGTLDARLGRVVRELIEQVMTGEDA